MYNLKIIKCKDKIEVYKYNSFTVAERGKEEEFYRFIDNKKDKNDRSTTSKNKKSKDQNRLDNLNNTRNKIIRLIRCNDDMQTFITLTFSKDTDYKKSKKYLNNLFNKLRKNYKNLKYLWILEYGDKNNRLHYHMLCNIPIEIKLSTSKQKKTEAHKNLEQKFRKKYWKYGFIDIRALGQEGNTNIALYVSTYIVKSLGNKNLEGFRIFGYSNKTLEKPIIEKYLDKRKVEEILKDYLNYKLTYCNSYPIAYTSNGEEKKGNVLYYDFTKNKGV